MISGMARTSPSVELSAADQSAAAGGSRPTARRSRSRCGVGWSWPLRRDNKTWPSLLPVESTAIPPHCGGGESWKPGSTRSGRHKPVGVVNRSMTCPSARADCRHLADQAQGHDPLELPTDGQGPRREQEHGQPALAIA